MLRSVFYIIVRNSTGSAFAHVGPYQSEDDAKQAANFSKIERYEIERRAYA